MFMRRVSLVVLASCLGIAGCTYYFPHEIDASNRPTKGTPSGKNFVRGESCQQIVLGIPLGPGNTVREALDAAKASAGTDTLTDITVDQRVFSLLIYAKPCTIVQGVPAGS